MDDNSVYRTLFFEETDDHLQQLNDHVLALESNPQDTALLNDIFRSAHTLKGMAATMGYDVMTQLTHKMENIFELFKTATLSVTSDSISLIFKCLDRLSELVEDLREEKELQPNQITDLLLELDQVEQQSQNQSDQQHSETTTSDTPLAQLSLAFEQLDSSDLFVIEQAVAGDYHAFSIAVRLEKIPCSRGLEPF